MSALMMEQFDPIEYAKQLRLVGVSQEQADVQAQTFEKVLNEIMNSRDLATKKDVMTSENALRKDIESNRLELEKLIESNRLELEKLIESNRLELEKLIEGNRIELERYIEKNKSELEKYILTLDNSSSNAMKNLEIRLIKWVLGTGGTVVLALVGILKFIH